MLGFMLQTVIEFSVAGFIIWGLFNEQTLVKFEDKIFAAIKKRFKASRDNKTRNEYHHESRRTNDRTCA